MPELPEVETTARELNKKLKGKIIKDVWTDWPKYFRGRGEKEFRKYVVGKKILGVGRKAKNVLIKLSDQHLLLIHQKLSGHLLVGKWKTENGKREDFTRGKREGQKSNLLKSHFNRLPGKWQGQKWVPVAPKGSELWDEKNRFIRLIFFLNDGRMLALSDLRRFAKVLCGPEEGILNLPDIKNLGPEPLEPNFTFKKFKALFGGSPSTGLGVKKGKIKQVLMDPSFISGIGNIYADEILWHSRIHPLYSVQKLKENQLKTIYNSTKKVLNEALRRHGTSIDDYRTPEGRKGGYGEVLQAYQREGEPCPRCGTPIKRIKIGTRSAHFCPICQKLTDDRIT